MLLMLQILTLRLSCSLMLLSFTILKHASQVHSRLLTNMVGYSVNTMEVEHTCIRVTIDHLPGKTWKTWKSQVIKSWVGKLGITVKGIMQSGLFIVPVCSQHFTTDQRVKLKCMIYCYISSC